MKEYINTIHDSFIDYAGKKHEFTIAAISTLLPRNTEEANIKGDKLDIFYEVNSIIEGDGIYDFLCEVTKTVQLGISICNPVDSYDEKVGEYKAIARARNNKPVLLSSNPGTINNTVVEALLLQEARFVKNNPSKYIQGYSEMEKSYKKRQEMNKLVDNFSDIEKEVVTKIKENPKFLDNIIKYLKWLNI